MSVKTINLSLDKDEYAFASSKKGSRTWKQVLFDGLEYKAYVSTKLEAYLQSRPKGPRTKTK